MTPEKGDVVRIRRFGRPAYTCEGTVIWASKHKMLVKVDGLERTFRLRDGYTSGFIGDRSGYRVLDVEKYQSTT